MNHQKVNEQTGGIYDSFKGEVCEDCKIKIQERLSKLSKVQMALLMARPKMIHKRLGMCQTCINNIHRKLLKKWLKP